MSSGPCRAARRSRSASTPTCACSTGGRAPSAPPLRQKPLLPGSAAQLHVLLRRRPPNPAAGSDERVMPFPDLVPLAARGREGTLSVRIAPALQASASTPLTPGPPPAPAGEKERAPWG